MNDDIGLKDIAAGSGGVVTFFAIVYGLVKAWFHFRLARPKADAEARAIDSETERRDDEYRSTQFVALIDRLQDQIKTVTQEVNRLQSETHALHLELARETAKLDKERQSRREADQRAERLREELDRLKGGGNVKA